MLLRQKLSRQAEREMSAAGIYHEDTETQTFTKGFVVLCVFVCSWQILTPALDFDATLWSCRMTASVSSWHRELVR
jgi:hypothetical protein